MLFFKAENKIRPLEFKSIAADAKILINTLKGKIERNRPERERRENLKMKGNAIRGPVQKVRHVPNKDASKRKCKKGNVQDIIEGNVLELGHEVPDGKEVTSTQYKR